MNNLDIIRAWKDEQYRNSLSEEQQGQLPENPAGVVELDDVALAEVEGGTTGGLCLTISTVALTFALTFNICGSISQTGSCRINTSGCC